MIFLQLGRPSPVPICLVVNNGSKILSILSGGIPGPSSDILMIVSSSSFENRIVIVPFLCPIA